jgi:hypothetical protein
MPKLVHPDLPGEEITVPDGPASVLALSGWQPVDGDTPSKLSAPVESPNTSDKEK